jgi:hypothetical protein
MMTPHFRTRMTSTLLLCGVVFALAWSAPTSADTTQDIGEQPNAGFPVRISGFSAKEASVTVADITGDNKAEIIVGDVDGRISAVSGTGQLLWQFRTDIALNNVWSGRDTPTRINSAPAVGDVTGDGVPEIVVGVGGVTVEYRDGKVSYENGGVVALNNKGQLLPGWPQLTVDIYEPKGYTEGVVSSPVIADFTGDGKAEIGYGGFDQYIYLKDQNGRDLPGWPRFARDTVWSSPAAVDLDGNGVKDMVIGIDAHKVWFYDETEEQWVQDEDGGYVLGLQGNAKLLPGWRIFQDDAVFSSPAVADLDGDQKPEIVIGSGNFWRGLKNNTALGRTVTAYRTDGSTLWRQRTDGSVSNAPAIGDVNGDGQFDVVVVADDGDDKVYAFNGKDGRLLWKKLARSIFSGDRANGHVILGDYDGDGVNDVFAPVGGQVAIMRGQDGEHFTGTSNPWGDVPVYSANGVMDGSPALGDLNGDGKLELVTAANVVTAWTLPNNKGVATWPMFRGTPDHEAVVEKPSLDPSITSLSTLVSQNSRRTYTILFGADWTVTETDDRGIITLNRTSGTENDPLLVTITTPRQNGTFTASITVRSAGLPSQVIPITVRVSDRLTKTHLPLTIR